MIYEDKFATISEKNQQVYEKGVEDGKTAEWSKFWDVFQDNGNRTNYTSEFKHGWSDNNFYPKYDINAKTCPNMFQNASITNLKQRLIDCGVKLLTNECTQLYYFGWLSKITHCPEIGNENINNSQNLFNGASQLVSVDKITLKNPCAAQNMFINCTQLQHITFCENFAVTGLNLQSSTKLTKESLLNLLNNLADKSNDTSGTQWAVTLGKTNLAKLEATDEGVAAIAEATDKKGWTLA